MRKYFKILFGFFRLFKEEVLNGFKIKITGIRYCINSGVKFWIRRDGKCFLGSKNWISENCIFECSSGVLTIGNNNFFNSNCRIATMNSVTIGDNNLFGPNVIIVDHNHCFSDKNKLICKQGFETAPITIGSDIWIGGNVTICAGVSICNHVVVGANSVVTRSIIEPGVYVGCPIKKIDYL